MKILRRMTAAVVLLASAMVVCAQEPYSGLPHTGPTTLLIAYKCKAENRVALREHMLKVGLANFEKWKKEGILSEYRILWKSYLDSETYDLLFLLTFNNYSDVARWEEIEKVTPGGLSEDGLKLVTSSITYSMDSVRQEASPQKPARGQSVFFIIPYEYLSKTDDYVNYLDNYFIPQADGWLKKDVLAAYTIYLMRYSTSRPWHSLYLLEYRDHNAFGLREPTMTEVRASLQSNAAWSALSEAKKKVRIEKETIIAEELFLP
jgi:hypothetical protein